MMPQSNDQLSVQCFVKKGFQPTFVGDNRPRLQYVSHITPVASTHPRIMHAHEDCIELILIYQGTSEFLIHDKKHTVREGDILIYNSGVVHDEVSGPGMEVGLYCAGISGLHMPDLRAEALISDELGYVFHTGKRFAALLSLFQLMYQRLVAGGSRTEEYCHSLMQAILLDVLSVVEDECREEENDASVLGLRIKAYIDEHFHEPITLKSISEELHISQYYLAHVFKQMSGYSPIQYILRRRIGEAQTLLVRTDLSIAEIAERVGYDTQSYFNYQFTKHVGMPPRRYRQNYVVQGGTKPKERKTRTKRTDT